MSWLLNYTNVINGVLLCLAVCFETVLIENLADDITPYPAHVQCKFSISSITLYASVPTRHTSPHFIIPHMTLVSLSTPLTTGHKPAHIYGLDAVYYSILIRIEVIRDKFNAL